MPQRDLLFSESTNKLILGSSGTFTLITIMSVIHYYPDYCLLAVFFYAHGWSTTTGSRIIVNSKALMCPLLFPHLWPFSFSNKYWEKLCDNRDKKKTKKKTHSLPKHTHTQHGHTPPRAPACAPSTTQNSQDNYCESQRHPSGTVIRPWDQWTFETNSRASGCYLNSNQETFKMAFMKS